jgi:hypothetical protein
MHVGDRIFDPGDIVRQIMWLGAVKFNAIMSFNRAVIFVDPLEIPGSRATGGAK